MLNILMALGLMLVFTEIIILCMASSELEEREKKMEDKDEHESKI